MSILFSADPTQRQRRPTIPAVGQQAVPQLTPSPIPDTLPVPRPAAPQPPPTPVAPSAPPPAPVPEAPLPPGRPAPIDRQPSAPTYTPPSAPPSPQTTGTKRDLIPDTGGALPGVTPTPQSGGPGGVPTPATTTTTTMAPVPNMTPGGTPEGLGFVPPPRPTTTTQAGNPLVRLSIPGVGLSAYGPQGDLRSGMITPDPSARATAARRATDAAGNAVANYNTGKSIGTYADAYQSRLATDPLSFEKVNPNVTGTDVNPNVDFQKLDTNVALRNVNPSVGFQGVDTAVKRAAVNPTIDFQRVNTDLTAGGAVNPTESPELQAYRQQQMNAAGNIANGPTRTQIAQDALKAFDLANAPGLQNQIRSVGQQAAKFGRLGMGETALETMRPFTELQAQRAALEKQLAADTATGEIQDRLNNLNAASGLVGQESAYGAGLRSEQRTERGYNTDIQSQNIANQQSERNAAMGLAERNQGRTAQEADTQANLAAQNVARAQAERDAAMGLSERNVGRDLGLAGDQANIASQNVERQIGERNMAADTAAQNIARQMANRDYSTGLAERNQARATSERNAALDVAGQNRAADAATKQAALEAAMGTTGQENAANLSRFNALSGQEQDVLNREAANRGEVRNERDFQSTMAQAAIDNALRQHQQENADYQQEYDNAIRQMALGYGVDPTAAYLGASNTAAGQANQGWQGASDALTAYLASRRSQQPTTGG